MPSVALISWFDGIGTARWALNSMGISVSCFITYETDVACRALVKKHFPEVLDRGDFQRDSAATILSLLRGAGLSQNTLVIAAAGPPCPDYSRIKGTAAPGRGGAEGAKFDLFLDTMLELRRIIDVPFTFLVENVVPQNAEDRLHFNGRMETEALLVDAADMGCIRRPRLWWMPDQHVRAMKDLPYLKDAFTTKNGIPRLLATSSVDPRHRPDQAPTGQYEFHEDVVSGRAMVPTLTTPATTSEGRPAPQSSRKNLQDPLVLERWRSDNRRFAPWHYEEQAILRHRHNSGEWCVPGPEVKEFLHMLPCAYTACTGASDNARATMLANGWHGGIARFLLALLVTVAFLPPATATIPAQPSPWGGSCLDRIKLLTAAAKLEFRAPARPPRMGRDAFITELVCPFAHCALALQAEHPYLHEPDLEHTMVFALDFLKALGPGVVRWRQDLLAELQDLIHDMRDDVDSWYAALPAHVQDAYAAKRAPAGCVAVPVLRRLGEAIGYPGIEALCDDLSAGFPLLGRIPPGTGWTCLDEPTPQEPTGVEEFFSANQAYAAACMLRRPDAHADELLRQVLNERRLNRVYGPFQAPASWGARAAPLPSHLQEEQDRLVPLLPAPQRAAAALAFSIVTHDDQGELKVRRGEDWRRSGHNGTTQVTDKPHYHTVDAYTATARAARDRGMTGLHVWGHDHEGAYRQCALADPTSAFFVLPTKHGPMIFQHSVLMFGAKGAVWGYGRVGDALVHIVRCLLAAPTLHFVDDYGGIEPGATATSAFGAFEDFNLALGFQMKPSKAQPPADAQVVQGVVLTVSDEGCTLRPKPARLRKVDAEIGTVLHNKRITPTAAGRLAGKAGFLSTTCFGQVGRAQTRPLFSRHYAVRYNTRLDTPLCSALHAMKAIFASAPPRTTTFSLPAPAPVLYADAFFELNGSIFRGSNVHDMPGNWSLDFPASLHNGWGFVLFPSDRAKPPLYAHGSVPGHFLASFAHRKAYIFVLEALAQCVPLWALHGLLSGPYWAFIDNDAARHALAKGYSGNLAANAMVSAFWTTAAAKACSPWFERVTSAANLSDKISRGCFTDAERLGWRRLEFDLNYTWNTLRDLVDSGSFDVTVFVNSVLADLAEQCRNLGL